jgi:hypothetical protein
MLRVAFTPEQIEESQPASCGELLQQPARDVDVFVFHNSMAAGSSWIHAVDTEDPDHSGEQDDEPDIFSPEIAGKEGEGIVHKRRGIRLKGDSS